MADSSVTAPVTGEEFATKEVAGVHHPKGVGEFADPSGDPVIISAANPQPVVDSAAVALLGTMDSDTSSLAGAVVTTDAVAAAAPTGIAPLMVRDDVTATVSPADGDWIPARGNARGAQWMALDTTLDATNDSMATGVRSGIDGCDKIKMLDLDETEEAVKASAGTLYGFYFANLHASSWRYLKVYDATVASVSVGTTVPDLTFPLPAASAGWLAMPWPVDFANAITVAATTGFADNDTGAPGANEVILNTFYK
jgi:hypothetical protein